MRAVGNGLEFGVLCNLSLKIETCVVWNGQVGNASKLGMFGFWSLVQFDFANSDMCSLEWTACLMKCLHVWSLKSRHV